MVKVYADGVLVYDPNLPDYALLDLTVTTGVDKAGSATITMPPGHPAWSSFVSYRTVVTIYRAGVLIFRGRALYPTDDFYNCRTITCEGERSFLRDSVMRPYLYQDSPAAILGYILEQHNAQVEEFKTFRVGTVTVTDPNNYVRLESSKAEQVADTLDKLVERVGGYLVFTTNTDGQRVINWYEELTYQSGQTIEFGENLLDYSSSGANTDLATVIIPYGAQNEETGERVTIESVNDGLDFIQDRDAVALRGVIAVPVYWDDVSRPENLLLKAQQYLASSKMMVTTLTLTAVDLSALDQSIDTFQVGDNVRVLSAPHRLDAYFQLRERTYDLLDPANDKVTLGKEVSTLTGADAAGDRIAQNGINAVEGIIRSEYELGIAQAITQVQLTMESLIKQTTDAILLQVSETYTTSEGLESRISTSMTQLADSFTFSFDSLKATVDGNDADAREQFETIHKYIQFVDGNIVLGESGNELTLRIENDRISFLDGGAEVAYFSNKQLYVTDGHFINSLRVGSFALVPRENGNLSLVKAGD